MGNLKNRDLQGQEILSQSQSTSVDDDESRAGNGICAAVVIVGQYERLMILPIVRLWESPIIMNMRKYSVTFLRDLQFRIYQRWFAKLAKLHGKLYMSLIKSQPLSFDVPSLTRITSK